MKPDIKEFAFYLKDRHFVWNPHEEITVYQLAVILPGFISFNHITDPDERDQRFLNWYEGLPDCCKQHFDITYYDQTNDAEKIS